MASFALYTDAALTTPLSGPLSATQASDGSSAPADMTVWLGSTDTAKKIQANSNPGVAQITAAVVDANAGTGVPASAIKLALSQAGLTAATPGASLNLGTQIIGGSANAVPIWIRWTDATHTIGTYTDISISIANLRETTYP